MRVVWLALVLALSPLLITSGRVEGAGEGLVLQLVPASGPNGTAITLRGSGAPPGSEVGYIYGGFTNIDACLNNRTSGQGIPGSTTIADSNGNFTLIHLSAERSTTGAIRFLAYASGVPASSWVCFQITAGAPTSRYFPETGKTASGRFLTYWYAHGDLAFNGYPISDEFRETLEDGNTYLVQYFERVRMEYHPEFVGTEYEVSLGQFGRRIHPADPPVPFLNAEYGGCSYYPQTGHNVCRFRGYYVGAQAEGGADFGLPISEQFMEILEDGNRYMVQYFERARLEMHPEIGPGAILLGQFGRRVLSESRR